MCGVGWKLPTLVAVLWVVALGVWAGVAAGPIGGPWGAVAGSVLTVLAGVVTAYIPSFRDEFRRRAAGQAQAKEALRQAGELPGGGPAGLLDPRRALVSFIGRERVLAALLGWCEADQPRGVRLVTGPGGVGKTRLSVELCARLEPLGWRCVRVGDGEEAAALGVARRGWPGRVLLVVDYAETRLGLGELLRAVAGDAGPVRVLLLARSAGEWRDRLAAAEPAVRELLAGAGGDDPLPVAVAAGLSDEELVAAAVPEFAGALGVAVPAQVRVEMAAGPVRVLDLHAAALVAVLRAAGAGGGPVVVPVAGVLAELLGHEERFWLGSARRAELMAGAEGMTAGMLRQVVAAGALLGGDSEDRAVELLGRVPGATASVKVACWLRDLYPPGLSPGGGGVEWLGTLGPDRLAEHLVVGQLTASPELARRCLTGLDERQALRAVTLLGRAAADQQDAAGALLERVLPLLEQVVADLPAELGLLTAISDAIPYPSAALAEADLAVTRRILDVLPAGDRGLRARWLSWLGTALAQTGRWAEALPPAQEAVAIYRELVEAYPDRYRPDLAASLSNLGIWFSELGRLGEALPPTQEAVAIYRELVEAYPDRYRPDLARSLSNLGVRFSALGRPGEALPPTHEAVAIYRELVEAYPDRYRPDLARSLSNLGIRFSALGRPGEALPPTQEAVAIRRELATAYPDRYRPDLATSLDNLGIWFSELGRPGEALPPTQEAVAIYRELVEAYPDRYRPDLARSLSNLGVRFWELGRPGEALPPTQEAVAIYQELATAYPDRYRPDLAASLSNLGVWFSALGRPGEALPPTQEAVAIRRELAEAYPDRYRPDLATSLDNLGVRFSELGRPGEALPAEQEAVAILRELASAYPDRYRPDLARSLRILASALDGLDHVKEAEAARHEADLES
jgi:tetratricopeptide (TPR) repeat protein